MKMFTYVDQKKKEAVGLAAHVNYSSTANCRANFLQYFEGYLKISAVFLYSYAIRPRILAETLARNTSYYIHA
jgi:hypothetical protein